MFEGGFRISTTEIFQMTCPILKRVNHSVESKFWKFPNSLIPRKLISWSIRPIKKLNIIDQFSVLGVPRLLQSLSLSISCNYTYFLATKSTMFDNFDFFWLSHANTFCMAQKVNLSMTLWKLITPSTHYNNKSNLD